jgi:hypothetical protein
MDVLYELKSLLLKIQRTYARQRTESISQLQDKIWNEPNEYDEELQQVLSDLASDLNFYENDPRDRDEALGYYGDQRLSEIITSTLEKISEYLRKNNLPLA